MTNVEKPYPVTVSELHRPLLSVVPDSVADGSLSVDELGSRIIGTAGRLAAATCRWLLLVADFDARDGARKFCLPSTARWLTHYCGLSRRTAIEHVKVARALAAHPVLVQAMSTGRISYSHVRAIARVAELGDERLVGELVMVAEHGTVGQLEDMVRGLRTVDEHNKGPADRAPESVSQRWREDSRFGLSAVLEPEHGALMQSAIETLARREGISQAQALTRMAEISLATLNDSDAPAPSLRGDEYAAVVIHLDAAQLPAEHAEPVDRRDHGNPQGGVEECSAEHTAPPHRPYARIGGGPGLADATVHRLLCSGRIRTIIKDQGGTVLDIGANRRLVSAKQFRALLIRDHGACTMPGCGSTIGLEAHHAQPWLYGGKTIMANLLLLCRAHHHALHEHEFSITTRGDQRFRFQRPDGRELPTHTDPSRLTPMNNNIEDDHPHVQADAATTRWDGTRLDRHYAVAVLAQGLTSTPKRTA